MNQSLKHSGTNEVAQAVRAAVEAERQRIFDLSLDMFCVAGLDGYFKQINQSFVRTLGYTREHLLSKPFISFVHPDDVASTWEAITRQSEGESIIAFENRYRDVDGDYLWLSWNTAPPTPDGMLYAVARDVTESKRMQRMLRYATTHDALTGAANRNHLHRQLKQAFARSQASVDDGFALLFIDIDGFRQINDTHGYQAGDELLRRVAERINSHLRSADATVAVHDLCARMGGDEFVVLLDPVKDAIAAHEVAGMLESTIIEPYRFDNLVLSVAASIGVVTSDGDYPDANAMLGAADNVMHRRKNLRAAG